MWSLMMIHFNVQKSFALPKGTTEMGTLWDFAKTPNREIEPDTITLPEINVVSDFDYQTKKIGYYKKGFFDVRRNLIVLESYLNAICIQFEGGPFLRKNILESIKIDAKKKDSQCMLKLYFKEVDQFGQPGRTIFSLENTIDPSESVHDLSNYQITIPKNDFYLCLEVVDESGLLKEQPNENNIEIRGSITFRVTENKYDTPIYIGSIHNVGWIEHDSNSVPRIELNVKGFN